MHGYTDEKHIQLLIALLKEHGIKRVIASPGTTNVTFVGSIQYDNYFTIYSSVDERSAAYLACGLAEETGEPVILICTGATASRNYFPGLTEAFYRKIPVLAITATQNPCKISNNIPQILDLSTLPKDTSRFNLSLGFVHNEEDEWVAQVNINKAILELYRDGGGPVTINLETRYTLGFNALNLPSVKVIRSYEKKDIFPNLPIGNIAVYSGSHQKWSDDEIDVLDLFCEKNNAVVFCDHTSNYRGKYRVLCDLIFCQQNNSFSNTIDLLIHIGNISSGQVNFNAKDVWRVNPDGEIRDTFKKLSSVFKMSEKDFFHYFANNEKNSNTAFYESCSLYYKYLLSKINDLPFSNIWIAQQTSSRLPHNSILHLGIVNTLRSWNFFETPKSIREYSNTGGFGIDGNISSLIGASLADYSSLYFGIIGDLAFFYDMNSLGNRIIKNNLRIMIINNGRGTEFRLNGNPAATFGDEADNFMAAAGHFGNKSSFLVKHYAEDLGFLYITASNKNQFLDNISLFTTDSKLDKPVIFEVFTCSENETQSLEIMRNLDLSIQQKIKTITKTIIGQKNIDKVKNIIKK